MNSSLTYLCVGGPLDGQHRTLSADCIGFRVTRATPTGVVPAGPVQDQAADYIIVWSREHARFVWWCAP